jgi:hypothetical protein
MDILQGERHNRCTQRDVLCDRRPLRRAHRCRAPIGRHHPERDGIEQTQICRSCCHTPDHGTIKEQFHTFIGGLKDVILLELLLVFDECELEQLTGGMKVIDMDDWMQFTDYYGYEKTDCVIKWFWACLCSWPMKRRACLLQVTTGTSCMPVNGFKDLQGSDCQHCFTIKRSGDLSGPSLLHSHTCFNQLFLPLYEDYETLECKLCFAIEYICHFIYIVLAHGGFVGRQKALGRHKGAECDSTTEV